MEPKRCIEMWWLRVCLGYELENEPKQFGTQQFAENSHAL